MSKPVTPIKYFVIFLVLPFISSQAMVDTALFAQNSAKFSVELYNVLSAAQPDSNLIFSPFSVQTCVALAFAGASGTTAQEIANGLHLVANDPKLVGESFKAVLDGYANSTLLKVANKVYVKKGYALRPEFNEIATKSFHSSGEEIDFVDASAANTINKWVEEKTNNKIKDIIPPGSLDGSTRLVLVNAIHFKGEWQYKFEKEATRKEDFYLNDKDSVKVDMMNGKAKFKFAYFHDLACTALEMPYRNSDLSMLILLPDSRTGLKDLEAKLQNANLLELTEKMHMEEVIVKFPKFKVEFSAELKDPMTKLGMSRMFSDGAEFGNILVEPEELKVSKVIHKAFIEVNEEGAEAAAATAVILVQITSVRFTPQPKRFYADHPYLYAIKSKESVLFLGRNVNF